ncbi:MAG TPA: tRNA uridine-5-carboxymethylaminomethyl(34) synthesis GTPase MnmE, partial [Gammaproteobacteria bacterium]|nr:tRNA uridine-5-carboxymethylaminomethyl(34) synthesis GTPase MnmE [Gammaproteobacteria bacterium]
ILYVTTEENIEPILEWGSIPTIIIRNKIDLLSEQPSLTYQQDQTIVAISAKHNIGVDFLKEAIKSVIGFKQNEGTFSARQRHIEALNHAIEFLSFAYTELVTTKAGELVAENLRLAQQSLSEITGEFSTEDLLGRIFSSFCIGK